ncbi:MAG: methyltransferase domain-containing protein [Mycobacterium sp.]|uniref:class I SAM-dependent DNA methyltransferase n=1 Tax=Mycobacterium sp. TaxID=1785 RepID=UPI001EB4D5DE|nr:SAM-dependent methyltransferase [Mycobacterium sp.]MBV8788502.1 methyltransferase domain-containing protein [Mycobacterium sp.]
MRLPDAYFDRMYADTDDPWQLSTRWYEQRKYAITLALLPNRRYRHAFEPGCSIGTLTAQLAQRCDHVTAVDVAEAAVRGADERLADAGCRDRVTLACASLDAAWPAGPFDLLVLSEVAYYLSADALAAVLRRECPRLAPGATIVAAHWRHSVPDYPLTGDAAHGVISQTPGLTPLGCYRDSDVVVDVFDTDGGRSVAVREGVPGAR